VLLLTCRIVNALEPYFEFFSDKACQNGHVIDFTLMALGLYRKSSSCVWIDTIYTDSTNSVSLVNPNNCVLRVYADLLCNDIVAIDMKGHVEPSCTRLRPGLADYYCSISCELVN
jgi:hypothetical protein